MLSLSLALISKDVLLLKFATMSLLDSIQASGVLATFAALIDLAIDFILG